MARPRGITVLGALLVFTGACTALLGAVVLRNPGNLADWVPAQFLIIGPAALGGLLVFSGVLNLALGWGLLKLMNWARAGVLLISGLSLIGAALGILASGLTHDPIGTDVNRLILFAIYGVVVWYLLRPECKQAFTSRTPRQHPGVPPAEPPLPPAT